MFVADLSAAGYAPAQHHDPAYALALRLVQFAGRVRRRDPRVTQGRYELETGTRGDVTSWLLWKQEDRAKRELPAWGHAFAATVREAAMDDRGGTRTAQDEDESEPGLRPIRSRAFAADLRFERLRGATPAWSTRFPRGWGGALVAGTEEHAQIDGFVPGAYGLCAPHRGGEADHGTAVLDLRGRGDASEVDEGRRARLQSLLRVVVPESSSIPFGDRPVLALEHGLSAKGGHAGYGLFAADSPDAPEGAPAEPPVEDGLGDGAGADPGNGGTIVRGRPLIPVGSSQARGAQAGTGGGAVATIACAAHRAGGPLDVGGAADLHQVGRTRDGEPIHSGHLNTESLFRGDGGDGPLDFEAVRYVEPRALPHLSRVHLRWDPEVAHRWIGGAGVGKWRWLAETAFYRLRPRKPPSPPPPPREPPPPPLPPPVPPEPPPGGGTVERIPGGTGRKKDPTRPELPRTGGSTGLPPGSPFDPPPGESPLTPGPAPLPPSDFRPRPPEETEPEEFVDPSGALVLRRLGRRGGVIRDRHGLLHSGLSPRDDQYLATAQTVVAPALVLRPLPRDLLDRVRRRLVVPENLRRRIDDCAPAVGRLEAWAPEPLGDCAFAYTERPGASGFPGGTATGGWGLLPPEVRLREFIDSAGYPSGRTVSGTHLAFLGASARAAWASSLDRRTGLPATGVRAAVGTLGRLGFAPVDSSGVALAAKLTVGGPAGEDDSVTVDGISGQTGSPFKVRGNGSNIDIRADTDGVVAVRSWRHRHTGTSPVAIWYGPGVLAAQLTLFTAIVDTLYAIPFVVPVSGLAIDRLDLEVTTAAGGGKARIGIYRATSFTQLYPAGILVGSAELDISTTGLKEIALTPAQDLDAGAVLYLALLANTSLATFRAVEDFAVAGVLGHPAGGGAGANTGWSVAQAYGALPGTYPAAAGFITSDVPQVRMRFSA